VPTGLQFNPGAYLPLGSPTEPGTVLGDPALAFTEGNAGRNSLRGPGFFEADWELGKTFQITERKSIAFAWQNFNVFNNVNRGLTVNDVDSSSAGQITSLETFALPRTMQFSLRFNF